MSESERVVGVVPAAGQAARLQPLPASKEVLVVRGRPVLDHVVERLRRAEPDEIRVVTRPDKADVAERARHLGAVVVEASPPTFAASVERGAAGLGPDDVVLLGLPDTIWEPEDGFALLLAELRSSGADVVLGVFGCDQPERSDVVALDDAGAVHGVDVKPARPTSSLVWGCVAARRSALAGLAADAEPGRRFDALARAGRVRGVHLSDEFVDIGTPETLAAVRS